MVGFFIIIIYLFLNKSSSIFHALSRTMYVVTFYFQDVATEPHLLIGWSLPLSISGLGGGAEKVLKLSDRGREEGREACLRRSPSSI